MLTLVLIRGLPGSGKSTLAKTLSKQYIEADMYFVEDGEYNFRKEKLGAAHAWCQAECERDMQRGVHPVVVSNTFTTRRELEPYLSLAERYGYDVQTIICKGPWKSVHNVPEETINRMRARWED